MWSQRSFQKTNDWIRFTSMRRVFVRFLEESSARKKCFEIIWPLTFSMFSYTIYRTLWRWLMFSAMPWALNYRCRWSAGQPTIPKIPSIGRMICFLSMWLILPMPWKTNVVPKFPNEEIFLEFDYFWSLLCVPYIYYL